MQVDHAIPMEFYNAYRAVGKDLNALSNLLPACRSCNNYKSSYTMEKFRKAIERMPEVLQRGQRYLSQCGQVRRRNAITASCCLLF